MIWVVEEPSYIPTYSSDRFFSYLNTKKEGPHTRSHFGQKILLWSKLSCRNTTVMRSWVCGPSFFVFKYDLVWPAPHDFWCSSLSTLHLKESLHIKISQNWKFSGKKNETSILRNTVISFTRSIKKKSRWTTKREVSSKRNSWIQRSLIHDEHKLWRTNPCSPHLFWTRLTGRRARLCFDKNEGA